MEVFFYGLFMDLNILSKNGIEASNIRKGYLDNYTLKIGNRASLIPSKHKRSYGLVMSVDKNAIQSLYAEASVADYIPEDVVITLNSGDTMEGVCYNLPAESLTGTNASYAKSLHSLAESLDFPSDYLKKIKVMSEVSDL
ncbi:gamma-glutamylcyclotransferase family protein [Roseivirga sp. E12]|uniref:gamma-glutamylcyclotransferase family protein n=1 Tax=Roseivirga sp. E12 TaxID=2819237 RepID=UPI001ABCF0F0|nr:gamma-glutamylcyclotransferase family protein [Roseivirga sp. E12]MBO3698090.1 gamma-glutamylcyclotransferase [Roseivirga sp. E12]